MANGFDRLERFFSSRRKMSAPALEPAAATNVVAPEPEQTFPPPSFMRPTTTRMIAREDVSTNKAGHRSSSLSVALVLQRTASSASYCSNTKNTTTRLPSLVPYENDSLIASLSQYTLIQESASRGNSNLQPLLDLSSLTPPIPEKNQKRTSTLIVPVISADQIPPEVIPPARVDTPPSSEPEDNTGGHDHSKAASLIDAPPTPESSPELDSTPVFYQSRASESLQLLTKTWKGARTESNASESSCRESFQWTDGPVSSNPSPHTSFCSSILREPDLNDFLDLSDDDIAEETADADLESLASTLPPMDLSISPRHPSKSSLITLAPPRTTHLATAAAFVAARIASSFDFDLVYVVNLWPDQTRNSLSISDTPNAPRPMAGRLLAAHGLHHVPTPLQISSNVHSIILRTGGWVEYRNEAAQKQDLARGYACGFYTGQYRRSFTADSTAPEAALADVNRGIVFAAYRKPRDTPSILGRDLKEEDLGNLHAEAEALVEMLIDAHIAHRLRNPPKSKRHSDDVGPMPTVLSTAA